MAGMFVRVNLSGVLVIYLALVLPGAFGANILISSMYGEGSHFLVGSAIGEGLVARGHNVTSLIHRAYDHRASDPKHAHLNFEVFDLRRKSVADVHGFWRDFEEIGLMDASPLRQMATTYAYIFPSMGRDCEDLLLDESLMARLEDIDAIVMDVNWLCGLLIKNVVERRANGTKKITSISVVPFPPFQAMMWSFGAPYNPAYQPEIFTGFSNRMTFIQRTSNLLMTGYYLLLAAIYTEPTYRRITKNAGLADVNVMDLLYLRKTLDLHLINADFSVEFPFPLAPNFKAVGGLTARPAGKLDSDLEEFVQSSGEHGVVVFTLGTYFATAMLNQPGFVEMFADAFRRVSQKVIWGMNGNHRNSTGVVLPPNVRAMPWIPQNNLLGHPKTRAFISQGGNNGFQEACYHGVPMVVIPLHVDQFDVATRVEARGMGRKLDRHTLGADVIFHALNDVMRDPKYANMAKEVSVLYRSRPMGARERAAFWVDHVIKFGGDHLRMPVHELSFIEGYMIDVFALLLAVTVVSIVMVVLFVRFVITCFSFRTSKFKQN